MSSSPFMHKTAEESRQSDGTADDSTKVTEDAAGAYKTSEESQQSDETADEITTVTEDAAGADKTA